MQQGESVMIAMLLIAAKYVWGTSAVASVGIGAASMCSRRIKASIFGEPTIENTRRYSANDQ
ncbi:hypothetical protein ASE69_03465 [Sphingomonas sp. Leaf208]|nr:hypothetical protein ASE69_03465 [Sphingomonas sp. Leaf208]